MFEQDKIARDLERGVCVDIFKNTRFVDGVLRRRIIVYNRGE